MKTKMILKSMLITLISINSYSETIAVTNFNTTSINANSEKIGKLARLEMVKIQKYTVMDEFDMQETFFNNKDLETCYGKTCLIELGEKLKADFVLSGSVDGFGNKIVVQLKLIDVKAKSISATKSLEFEYIEEEIQRMIGITIQELFGLTADPIIKTRLEYKNDVITSNNVGKMNNSGPRMGVSYIGFGELNDFFTRNENLGGLDILPVTTNIGYQFEAQYIGTENFSALGELIFNVGGMEQGRFIPSVTLLNGFRFGRGGWEIAFGPSFGLRKTKFGYTDPDGVFYSKYEWENKSYQMYLNNPENFDPISGDPIVDYKTPNSSIYERTLDTRGTTELNASWIIAFGRTFRSGALNIPVNVYYSSNQYGGIIGTSVGFNVTKNKKSINQ